MRLRTIADEHAAFEALVVPKGASENQVDMMKLAFYAGASAVVTMVKDLGEPGVSEAVGLNALVAMHQECIRYARERGIKVGLPTAVVDTFAPAEKIGTRQ